MTTDYKLSFQVKMVFQENQLIQVATQLTVQVLFLKTTIFIQYAAQLYIHFPFQHTEPKHDLRVKI